MASAVATLLAVAVLALPVRGTAVVVGGGGGAATDCLGVFAADANIPPARPRHIRCVDGDPCDTDGEVNGSCTIPVAFCANSTFDPGRCDLNGVQSITVDHALDDGDPRFDPDFQALQSRIDGTIDPPTTDPDVCTGTSNFIVPVRGPFGSKNRCGRGRKVIRVTTVSQVLGGKVFRDRDRMRLLCMPAAVGCDPMTLFTGAFDRIQRQIFNQSCAKSACHDSETTAGGLLLETGASHTNLVNVDPTNPGAAAAGWKRVTVTTPDVAGDPDTSFLYHKVTPTPGFGGRMPADGPPYLHSSLRDVIYNWILYGAPETGWPDGTF